MKRRRRIRRSSGLGAVVVGAVVPSVIGSAMPGTTGTALTTAGTTFSKFVGPVATVTGAGMVMKQLRKFPKPRRIRRRKR